MRDKAAAFRDAAKCHICFELASIWHSAYTGKLEVHLRDLNPSVSHIKVLSGKLSTSFF